jgi:nitric oxide dioxygenase
MSLSAETIAIIKSTVPVLQAHGVEITSCFYKNMFAAHPELHNFFNDANQATKKQQGALAHAVYAAAAYIDKLEVILPAIQPALHKHVALGVTPEQYAVVGEFLLKAIKEVLGDAATDEILDAWGKAYQVIADIFISLEKDMYAKNAAAPGGWVGFMPFTVVAKTTVADNSIAIELKPKEENAALASYKAGQYITVKAKVPGYGEFEHNRHYSLSKKHDGKTFQITPKRDGKVSTWLLDFVQVGDEVQLSAPAGPFCRDVGAKRHIFVAGGVGVTPLLAMAQEAVENKEAVDMIYCIRSKEESILLNEVEQLAKPGVGENVFVKLLSSDENVDGAENVRLSGDFFKQRGYVDTEAVYYASGSDRFIKDAVQALKDAGVQDSQMRLEVFAPSL